MDTERSFPKLDIALLVMALLVVEMHTVLFCGIGLNAVTRVVITIGCAAIPFFFVASGFLCFRGLTAGDLRDGGSPAAGRMRGIIRRQFLLCAAWTVAFIPPALLGGALLKGWGVGETALRFAKGMLLAGGNDFTWPLWFLLASAVACSLAYLLLRKGVPPVTICALAAILLLLGYVADATFSFPHDAPAAVAALASACSGLFEGFFYVAVGMYIGLVWDGREVAGRIPAALAGTAVGLAGCIAATPDPHLPFCALLAISLFILCAKPASDVSHPWARKAAAVVFLVHMVFIVVFAYGICGYAQVELLVDPATHAAMYAFSVGCSLLVAAAVIPLGKKIPPVKAFFGL